MRKKGIAPDRLLVIHDDLDMELARIRIKRDGGDGGHKGVRSIAESLGTKDFYRMKIGIGRDPAIEPEALRALPLCARRARQSLGGP